MLIRKGDSYREYLPDVAGGKGHNLLRLSEISDDIGGFRVPDFVILPVGFRGSKSDLEEVYDGLRKPLAVRSSSPWEDSEGLSFAGIFHSFLNIDDYHMFLTLADDVLRSARGFRAVEYARRHDINIDDRMAVIVQEMIEPKISGVCYSTANPNDPRTIVEFLQGLSDKLMSGLSQGSMATFDQNFILTDSYLYDNVKTFVSELGEVAHVARTLDDIYGCRLDVEFALSGDGVLYIVQARPITDPEWPDTLLPDIENERIILTSDVVRGSGIFRGPVFVIRSPKEATEYYRSRNMRTRGVEQYQQLREFNYVHKGGYCLLTDTLEAHRSLIGELDSVGENLTNLKSLVTVDQATRFSHTNTVVAETGAFYVGTRGRKDVMDLIETGDTISVACNQSRGIVYDLTKPVIELHEANLKGVTVVQYESSRGMIRPPYEDVDDRLFIDQEGSVGVLFWDYNEENGFPTDVFYSIIIDGKVVRDERYESSRVIHQHPSFFHLLNHLFCEGKRYLPD